MDKSIGASSTGTNGYLSESRGAASSRPVRATRRQQTIDAIPGAGRLKAIFLEHDVDRSGTISRDELAAVLQALMTNISEKSITLLFEQIDGNNDGELQYEEFIDWLMDDGIGPIAGNEMWYNALEAILTQGLFLTSTGLCGRWSARKRDKNSRRRETYSLLSCGVVAYSKQDQKYSGGACSVDHEEVSGFGEWHVKDSVLEIRCSVHVELSSGSGVHVDRLERDERRHEQFPLDKFEAQFSRTGVLDGPSEVRIMLAMFGGHVSDTIAQDLIISALGDSGGHTGKAAYLLHKRKKEELKGNSGVPRRAAG